MIANDVLQKRCRTCGDEFPATTEFFYRNKGCTDGLLGQCKACIGEKAKVYRKRIEENRQAPAAERRCTACGNIFPGTAELFGRKKESIDGLNTQCKACWNAKTLAHQKEVDQRHPEVRERRLAWHRAHYRHPERHEHKLAWRKEYESRPEVQEHRRVWSKAYYNSRPDVQERRRARAKAYEGRPDVQARLKAYRKAYNRRPEVRERYIARENRPDRQAYRKAYKSRPDTQSHRLAY